MFRQNRSIHDGDEKTACTGTNERTNERRWLRGDGGSHSFLSTSGRPNDAATIISSTIIVCCGRIGVYCRFFASLSTRGAPNLFRTIRSIHMPYAGGSIVVATKKKIRRNTDGQRKQFFFRHCFFFRPPLLKHILISGAFFLHHGKENAG
jgi:hypothetical protein